MATTTVPLADVHRQYETIKTQLDDAIIDYLSQTHSSPQGELSRFEYEFAQYCETRFAVGVNNGISALELGLRALDIGAGDEIIMPANTSPASALAVSLTGATPLFVDIDPNTYTIDVRQIERHISRYTRAMLVVHAYGQPAEMDTITELADDYNLAVVEDACQAHGARYHGQRVGSFGRLGVFSFYPGKNLSAYGDGGAVVTNDPAIAERVRAMRSSAQYQAPQHYDLARDRWLPTLQAAVLRVKLRYLDEWNALRRRWASLYTRLLTDNGVVTPVVSAHCEHVHNLYVIQVAERQRLRHRLASNGIASGIHYPLPTHLHAVFDELGYRVGDFPAAEHCAQRIVSLPMFPELTAEEVRAVAAQVRAWRAVQAEPQLQTRAVGL